MIALPLALLLSNSVTEVGAIAAFAALLGIAILSLLAFSQAREIKRLREWAGRAPERAAEMEQRVSADAAARLQRGGHQPTAPAARVAPRKTPLVSAPVSTAVNATVAAVVPTAAGSPAPAEEPTADAGEAGKPAATPPPPEGTEGSETGAPAPATAAARAVEVSARSPLPPSPAAPAPPGAPSASESSPQPSSSPPASAGAPVASAAKPASRPPAPGGVTRRVPSRAVGGALDAPGGSPSAPRARAGGAAPREGAAGGRSGVTRPATAAGAPGPKYFKPERSSGRGVALIAVGVIVGALVLIFAVTALKGGGSKATQGSAPRETRPASSHARRSVRAVAGNPAETAVVVLNGTATAGLAHHLAADLQQSGYTRAAASAGVPPGTHATTVVEYTRGHRADAQAVAKKLNVTRVQAIEATISSLAGSSVVVVLAGADQASLLGGGGAQSNGEPAAGTPAG